MKKSIKSMKAYLGGTLSHEIELIQQYMENLYKLRHEKNGGYAMSLETRLENACKYKEFIESGGRNIGRNYEVK